jgi:magnesium transporter
MTVFSKRYHPPGTAPGTLAGAAVEAGALNISLINYTADRIEEFEKAGIADCRKSLDRPDKTWIHVTGRPDPKLLTDLGQFFGLHPLALEDVLNAGQRPKADVYEGQLFVVMSEMRQTDDGLSAVQISFFQGENFVISIQEDGAKDLFEPIRRRLRQAGSRLRTKDSDFLLYALIDLVVDRKFPLLERIGERIEKLDDELLEKPSRTSVGQIHELKRDLLVIRRFCWPEREVIGWLLRDDASLIGREVRTYLRDCYDHAVQIIDLLETYREMVSMQMEVYLSAVSHRLNEIIRVLTVISTIFIPLTFITSLYGMNFQYMPELHTHWGYPLVLLVMGVLAVLMILWFWRRGWLRRTDR